MRTSNERSYQFALRNININNWRTPVVTQYKIKSIPYCMVYDETGTQVMSSSEACYMIAEKPEMFGKL